MALENETKANEDDPNAELHASAKRAEAAAEVFWHKWGPKLYGPDYDKPYSTNKTCPPEASKKRSRGKNKKKR